MKIPKRSAISQGDRSGSERDQCKSDTMGELAHRAKTGAGSFNRWLSGTRIPNGTVPTEEQWADVLAWAQGKGLIDKDSLTRVGESRLSTLSQKPTKT
jgi:hypothetical protein